MPVSVVESSALSPQGLRGSVTNRDCSHADATLETCVVTAVHRTSGGAIAVQNFSPLFESNADASLVGSLPSGITAAGTPKIIEDTSQIASTDTTTPARLRVLTRATDGNIYMVRYERGSWKNWMSLGRPWVCAAGADCTSIEERLPPPLRPFAPADATLRGYAAPTTTNSGISIAGEPVVASKMLSNGQSVIGIFVRVSQIQTDGDSAGKPGNLHNSVFFTMSVTPAAPSTVTTNLLHDQVNNWTPWSPIYNAANFFKTLGNPAVLVRPSTNTTSHPLGYFTVFGVTNLLLPAAIAHHPPIMNFAAGGDSATKIAYDGPISDFWFNYGRNLEYAHLLIPSSSATATPYNYPAFDAVGLALDMFDGDDGIVTSDLTAVLTNTTPVNVRLYASAIYSTDCNFEAYSAVTAANNRTAPCHYKKALIANEVRFTEAVAGPPLNVNSVRKAGYTRIAGPATANGTPFLGKPGVVDITALTPTQRNYVFPSNTGSGTTNKNRNHLVFSRSLCPKSGTSAACDYGRPTIAFSGLSTTDLDAGGAFDALDRRWAFLTYHYSKSFDSNSGAEGFTNGTNRMIQAIYPTSDIVPIFSQMKKKAGFDVPVYYFFRDASGRLAHGWFESRSAATVGRKFWSAVTRGAFVN